QRERRPLPIRAHPSRDGAAKPRVRQQRLTAGLPKEGARRLPGIGGLPQKEITVSLFLLLAKRVVGVASIVVEVLKPLAPIWKLLVLPRRRKAEDRRRAGLPRLLCIVARHERWRYNCLKRDRKSVV